MDQQNTPPLLPYDIRRWDDHSHDDPQHALDEETERLRGLLYYRAILDEQRNFHKSRGYSFTEKPQHITYQLESRANRIAERLKTFNQPDITDQERAFLVSFVGLEQATSDINLYEWYQWRHYCVGILGMAATAHIPIIEAAEIQEGVDDGTIPDVPKPYILTRLRERYEQGDQTLER